MQNPQHPDPPKPSTDTGSASSAAPDEALAVEAVIEQAHNLRQSGVADIARRLSRGERLTAGQLYNLLHIQTLATWWMLIDRHLRHARDGRGLTTEQTVARFASWIRSYLDDDPGDLDTATSVLTPGRGPTQELALAHFDRGLALIRQNAARSFLNQVKTLVPACTEQMPASSTEQEMTA
ncbi:hypothetical protein ACFYUV_06625 [Nonomuraea sp. NPDC003560]|uniref:hypothetical protein n=1 Tax=Nonomuraea sp. NPDC003560 TaxID=3364341 RepID=UPI0036C2DC8C